jgi:hypothetical protein
MPDSPRAVLAQGCWGVLRPWIGRFAWGRLRSIALDCGPSTHPHIPSRQVLVKGVLSHVGRHAT